MIRFCLAAIAAFVIATTAGAQGLRPAPSGDIFVVPSAFLACSGNPYALCYYSGPDEATPRYPNVQAPALPCKVDGDDATSADCVCYAIDEAQLGPLGTNFVLIGSILNDKVRAETIAQCGPLGRNCLNMMNLNSCRTDPTQPQCQTAKVCGYLGTIDPPARQTLYDDDSVELISTFSFTYSYSHPFGSTNCSKTPGRYAGCMTASCTKAEGGLTTCSCPIADGKYQVGQTDVACDISPNVWSAADNILQNFKD